MEKYLNTKKGLGYIVIICGTLWVLNTVGLLIGLLLGFESFGEHFNKPNIIDGEEVSPMSFFGWKFNFWAAIFSLVLIKLLGGKISNISLNGYTTQEAEMPILNSHVESKNTSVLDNKLQKTEPEQEDQRNAEIEDVQNNFLFFYKFTATKKGIITTTIPLTSLSTNFSALKEEDPISTKLIFGFTAIDPELAVKMNLQIGDQLPLELTDKPVFNKATGEFIPNMYWADCNTPHLLDQ